jgi:DNA-binding CsgD family transcriptional regulator
LRIATARLERAQPVPEALCRLIEALGTRQFPRQLFFSVERMLGAGAAAVYAGRPAELRPVLGDWQAGHERLERHTTEFAGRYAAEDPAYRAGGLAGSPACVTTVVAREELPHPGHRLLMAEGGFTNRVVSLFPAWRGGWLSLHVLRRREHGELSDRMVEQFCHAAPLLGSLIGRHLSLAGGLEARLLARCPQLTPREARVALGLLRGRSSREIADALGIEVSSVHTYRKRAYRKLGAASLSDLFQLLLTGENDG